MKFSNVAAVAAQYRRQAERDGGKRRGADAFKPVQRDRRAGPGCGNGRVWTVGQCEWADYPTKVLEKHWPAVPRWRDIRTLTAESFYERAGLRTVDVVSGGFPCQPFSLAGKRRGKDDDRYLWPEMLRVIQEIRPAWVVGENVAGIVNLALDTVLSDLENIGYTCQAIIIPACAVDAAHERKRCAIISYSDDWCGTTRRNRKLSAVDETERGRSDNRGGAAEYVAGEQRTAEPGLGGVADGVPAWMDRYWIDEPDIPRITAKKDHRVDRLRALGNAVYWRQFYPIFRGIMELETTWSTF